MSERKKSTPRKIVSLLFSFLLSIILTVFFLCTGFRAGILNREVFAHNVADSIYYETLYSRLNDNLLSLLKQANMPAAVGEGVISENQVYIDGRVYVNSVLEGKHPEINTEEIEKNLRNNIYTYLEENEAPKEQMETGISEIIDTVIIDYKNSLSFKAVDYFYNYRQLFLSLTFKIMVGCVVLGLILIILLFNIYKRKHRVLRYISYALIASTAANTLFTLHVANRLQDWPLLKDGTYYGNMMKKYLTEGIHSGYYISLIGVILFLVCLVATRALKRKA